MFKHCTSFATLCWRRHLDLNDTGRRVGTWDSKAIKFGIRLVFGGVGSATRPVLFAKKIDPVPIYLRAAALLIPGFIYLMATKVRDVLKKSTGIRRQAIYIADWWLVFGLWQFAAGMGQGPIIALFAIAAVISVLSIKDAIQVQA